MLLSLSFSQGSLKDDERVGRNRRMMKRIAGHVRKGAMAYLRQQYRVVALVFLFYVRFCLDGLTVPVYRIRGYGLRS